MRSATISAALAAGLCVTAPALQSAAAPSCRLPPAQPVPYRVGKAAWYGSAFHGRQTASGEVFDMNQLTAAHPYLPMGTPVKVTNLVNRRSVIVRINDRGPARPRGRIIDLSYAASKRLGMLRPGVVRVRLDRLPENPPLAAD